jgi:hypothetical protein
MPERAAPAISRKDCELRPEVHRLQTESAEVPMRAFLAVTGLSFALLAGCNGHMDGDEQMSGHLDRARQEVTRHHLVVLSAETLDQVRADVALHEQNMGDIMMDMDGAMDGMMSHCSGKTGGQMDGMMDGMEGMHQGMTEHGDAMAGASTMEDAMAMCEQHAAMMQSMMDMVESGMDCDCM